MQEISRVKAAKANEIGFAHGNERGTIFVVFPCGMEVRTCYSVTIGTCFQHRN